MVDIESIHVMLCPNMLIINAVKIYKSEHIPTGFAQDRISYVNVDEFQFVMAKIDVHIFCYACFL